MNLIKSHASHYKGSLTFLPTLLCLIWLYLSTSSTIVPAHGREAPLWWRWLGRSRFSASPGRISVSDHDTQRCSKGPQIRHFQAWVARRSTKTTKNNQKQTCLLQSITDLYISIIHSIYNYYTIIYLLLTYCNVFWLLSFESQAADVSLQIYSS